MWVRIFCVVALIGVWGASAAPAAVVTFEEFGAPADSFDNGHPNGPNTTGIDGAPEGIYSGAFSTQGITFNNAYNIMDFGGDIYAWWDGFAVSSKTDVTTPGFPNEYSAITGAGKDSATYGIGFNGATVDLDSPAIVVGAYLTNTTYAYHAIENGDTGGFQNPLPFDAGDFLLLTITGYDGLGGVAGTLDYYLSDYRSSDSNDWYTVDSWDWLDMSSLGVVSSLGFVITGSDIDPIWGLNTPAYFAIDDFTTASAGGVPEPSTFALLGLALVGGCGVRRWQKVQRAAFVKKHQGPSIKKQTKNNQQILKCEFRIS